MKANRDSFAVEIASQAPPSGVGGSPNMPVAESRGNGTDPESSLNPGSGIALGEEPGPSHDSAPGSSASRPNSIGNPTSAIESGAALLGWLALTALGAARVASNGANHIMGVFSPWLAVFVAGLAVSILLALRRRTSRGVRHLLTEVLRTFPPISSVDPKESSRLSDGCLSDLLERTVSFVGGRAAALYVTSSGSDQAALRASVGRPLTSRAAAVAVEVTVGEARGATLVDDDPTWLILSSPLVIGDRVTGAIVVSVPKRWSKTLRLPRLQQIAEGAASVIDRARLGEEEWRNRLGAAHARGNMAILAEAAVTLSAGVESTDEAFLMLGRVVVPQFADWFAAHLENETGGLSSVSVGADDTGPYPYRGMRQDRHVHPDGEALVRSAMATGRPVVSRDLANGFQEPGRDARPEHALSLIQAAPSDEIGSLMVVPVKVQGRPIGALSFVTLPGRRGFRPVDLEAGRTLAGTVAATAERMLLVEQSEKLSASAERRANRLRRLVETALVVSTPLGETELLHLLAEQARRVLACRLVVVTSRESGILAESSAQPGPTHVEMSAVLEATESVLGRSRFSFASSSTTSASPRMTERNATTPTDWVAVPLDQAPGRAHRAMVAVGNGSEAFGPDDEAVLALLARMASVALERAVLYETLRSNEQRLTALVESSPLAIAELDLDGTVRWWNRAAGYLFGWDDPGRSARAIPVVRDAGTRLGELWNRAKDGQATVGALVAARRPSGELMELSLSVAPLEENDGTTGGILAVIEDVTEREQVLDQFHRAQRLGAMARLAGGIAHDFNNLVTVILGSSETLLQRIEPDDPLRPEVEAIHRVGKRAAALTGQLLQIGHRSSVQLVETDPREVIDSMSDELRRLLGAQIVLEITDDCGESRPLVLVDRQELERAMLNLVFNARDAMPNGGRLHIDTSLVPDHTGRRLSLEISVSDTGTGMEPTIAEHCFEPFFSTKGSASGTGLGLAIVHATVTQANGEVNVESVPGSGTTFTLMFPITSAGTSVPADRVQASNL